MPQNEKKQSPTAGVPVRDLKGGDVPGAPADNRIQVHQGNVPVLTVHFLSRISETLERIAKALEKNG